MWKYACARCSKAWICAYRGDAICPVCFGPVVTEATTEAATMDRSEWLTLQGQAWDTRDQLCLLPAQALDEERLNALLSPVRVQGELDRETGRFYLRSILLPDGGRLHLGVSSGAACIYQHTGPHE